MPFSARLGLLLLDRRAKNDVSKELLWDGVYCVVFILYRSPTAWLSSRGWTTFTGTCVLLTFSSETTLCARSPTSVWHGSSRTTSTQRGKVRPYSHTHARTLNESHVNGGRRDMEGWPHSRDDSLLSPITVNLKNSGNQMFLFPTISCAFYML